jgi:hypothetical protein
MALMTLSCVRDHEQFSPTIRFSGILTAETRRDKGVVLVQ